MQVLDVNRLWAVFTSAECYFLKTVWFILTVRPARCKECTTAEEEAEAEEEGQIKKTKKKYRKKKGMQ